MTLAALFSPIQHAIAEAYKSVALRLGKIDSDDLNDIVRWIQIAKDISDLETNEEKHKHVADLIKQRMPRVPGWAVDMVLGFVYQYAKKKGLVA